MNHLDDDALIKEIRKYLDSGQVRALIRRAIDRGITVEINLYEGLRAPCADGSLEWVDTPRIEVRGDKNGTDNHGG